MKAVGKVFRIRERTSCCMTWTCSPMNTCTSTADTSLCVAAFCAIFSLYSTCAESVSSMTNCFMIALYHLSSPCVIASFLCFGETEEKNERGGANSHHPSCDCQGNGQKVEDRDGMIQTPNTFDPQIEEKNSINLPVERHFR